MEKGVASSKTDCMPGGVWPLSCGLGKLWEASGKGRGISTPVFRQMTLVGRLWVRKAAWEGGYRNGASHSESRVVSEVKHWTLIPRPRLFLPERPWASHFTLCACVCENIQNIKFAILSFFKCTVQWHYVRTFTLLYNHRPHPSPELFSSSQTKAETLTFPPPSPQPLATTILLFCLYELDCSRDLI